MTTAARLMIQGTSSSAGKSVLVTGLCRLYARRGLRVAPFKAQNMALNSFVTHEGGEIGRSQAVQAEACGILPTVAMNPVLLKPNSDHRSQVIVNGRVATTLNAKEYYVWRRTLVSTVRDAFESLANAHDLVIIEGAGSPAEINLRENDLVNMGMAGMAESPVVLVGDIERGGVFASLYGTAALLEPEDRARIRGFVVNRFRGDVSILDPGLRQLEDLTHIPVLGVLPHWDIRIEEEDSLAERLGRARSTRGGDLDIAVVKLPRMANFTDFGIFDLLPGVALRYVLPGEPLGEPDMVIIPGSKSTIADMATLHETGTSAMIREYHAQGGVVAGICGGYQMLGVSIADPDRSESNMKGIQGLGLLDVQTEFGTRKRTVRTAGEVLPVTGFFSGAKGMPVEGYEIHMGWTSLLSGARPLLRLTDGSPEGAVSSDGLVFGTYMHGLFDSFPIACALVDELRQRRGQHFPIWTPPFATYREYRLAQYDRLADILEEHLDMRALDAMIGLSARKGDKRC